jgi:hypothetical protein
MTITFLDLRSEQHPTLFPRKKKADGTVINTSKVVGGKTVVRDPKSITGIVVHQTACVFGPSSDRQRAYRRALGIPAHVTAFRDGTFVAAADPRWFLYTSNGFNAFSYGIELEGQYPGLLDDPTTPKREDEESTWGGVPTPLTDRAIETFRAAVKWMVEEGRRLGSPLQYVWAHRQSNGQKRSDPGAGIWKHVVLDYAVPVLGLQTQNDRTVEDGKPIPTGWDSRSSARY